MFSSLKEAAAKQAAKLQEVIVEAQHQAISAGTSVEVAQKDQVVAEFSEELTYLRLENEALKARLRDSMIPTSEREAELERKLQAKVAEHEKLAEKSRELMLRYRKLQSDRNITSPHQGEKRGIDAEGLSPGTESALLTAKVQEALEAERRAKQELEADYQSLTIRLEQVTAEIEILRKNDDDKRKSKDPNNPSELPVRNFERDILDLRAQLQETQNRLDASQGREKDLASSLQISHEANCSLQVQLDQLTSDYDSRTKELKDVRDQLGKVLAAQVGMVDHGVAVSDDSTALQNVLEDALTPQLQSAASTYMEREVDLRVQLERLERLLARCQIGSLISDQDQLSGCVDVKPSEVQESNLDSKLQAGMETEINLRVALERAERRCSILQGNKISTNTPPNENDPEHSLKLQIQPPKQNVTEHSFQLERFTNSTSVREPESLSSSDSFEGLMKENLRLIEDNVDLRVQNGHFERLLKTMSLQLRAFVEKEIDLRVQLERAERNLQNILSRKINSVESVAELEIGILQDDEHACDREIELRVKLDRMERQAMKSATRANEFETALEKYKGDQGQIDDARSAAQLNNIAADRIAESLHAEIASAREKEGELSLAVRTLTAENETLRSEVGRIQELENQLVSLTAFKIEAESLRPFAVEVEDLRKLKDEVESLRLLKKELENLRPLQQEVEALKSQHEDTKALRAQLELMREREAGAVESQENEDALRSELEKALQGARQLEEALLAKTREVEARVKDLEDEKQRRSQDMDRIRTEALNGREEMLKGLQEKEAALEAAEETIKKLASGFDEKCAKEAVLSERLESERLRAEEAELRVRADFDKVKLEVQTIYDEKAKQLSSRMEEAIAAAEAANAACIGFQRQVKEAQEEASTKSRDLDALRERTRDALLKLNDEKKELQDKISSLQTELERKVAEQVQTVAPTVHIVEAPVAVPASDAELDKLRDENGALGEALELSRRITATLEADLTALRVELAAAQGIIKSTETIEQRFSAENAKLREDLATMKYEMKLRKDRAEKLLAERELQLEKLSDKLKEFQDPEQASLAIEMETALRNENEDLRRQLEVKRDEIERISHEAALFRRRLAEQQQQQIQQQPSFMAPSKHPEDPAAVYLRNVLLSYMSSKDSREQLGMVKAISQLAGFTPAEQDRIRKALDESERGVFGKLVGSVLSLSGSDQAPPPSPTTPTPRVMRRVG